MQRKLLVSIPYILLIIVILGGCTSPQVTIPTPTFSVDTPKLDPAPKLYGSVVYQSSIGGVLQIFVVNLENGKNIQLTNEGENIEPAWSPDGSQIAFGCNKGTKFEICLMNADGSGQRQITNNSYNDWSPDWSPDGKHLVYVTSEVPFAHLAIFDLSTSESQRLLTEEGNEGSPEWSPDGEQIIYMSDRGNYFNIYTVHPDGTNEVQVTTFGQDDRPSWSPDGKKIVFRRQIIESSVFSGAEVVLSNSDGSNSYQLTNDTLLEDWPTYSPNGEWIMFSADFGAGSQLVVLPINGGSPAPVTEMGVFGSAPDWKP